MWVLSDILQVANEAFVADLVLFDLCVIFDRVDYSILPQCLRSSFGIDGLHFRCILNHNSINIF